jgi:acyl-CoA thioester hydrolase
MIQHDVQVRVRYAETDKMGYVYYGNFATYLEVARVETMRHLGLRYKDLEDKGIIMPVLEYKTKFIKPGKYDDLLTIRTYIRKQPSARISFDYEIFNEAGELLNISETTLVFVNLTSGRPCNPPENFAVAMRPFFNE